MRESWTIDQIRPAAMIQDPGGHPLIRGRAFAVKLSTAARSMEITLVITSWAEEDIVRILGEQGIPELIRRFVMEELSQGWEPEHCPWLTMDSHSAGELLQHLSTAEK